MTKFRIGSIALLCCALFSAASTITAFAESYYWNAANGDWSDGTNWDPAGPPSGSDCAYIDNGGAVNIDADVDVSEMYIMVQNGTMNLNDYEVLIDYLGIIAAQNAAPVFNQSGGNCAVYQMIVGQDGQYNLSAGTVSTSRDLTVNSGEFNQSGGTCTIDNWFYLISSNSVYNLSAGTIDVAQTTYLNWAEINQSGGEHIIGKEMQVPKGAYRQSGGILEIAQSVGFGGYALGEFELSGGICTIGGNLLLGYGEGGEGVCVHSGGNHSIVGCLYLGYASSTGEGSGEYRFSGGALMMGGIEINNGWLDIDLSETEFFRVIGNEVTLLDGYILDGKIFDSTYSGEIYALYDAENDWTTLATSEAIPEPGTIVLIGSGVLALAGVISKRIS